MNTETFKEILSLDDYGIVDNNPKYQAIDRLERIRNYVLKIGPAKRSLWHITDYINEMRENQFHSTNEGIGFNSIRLRKMLLEW